MIKREVKNWGQASEFKFFQFFFSQGIPKAILMSDLKTMKIYFLKNYMSPIDSVLGKIKPISCKKSFKIIWRTKLMHSCLNFQEDFIAKVPRFSRILLSMISLF